MKFIKKFESHSKEVIPKETLFTDAEFSEIKDLYIDLVDELNLTDVECIWELSSSMTSTLSHFSKIFGEKFRIDIIIKISDFKDTIKVLDYNISNNIYQYRMSSDSFPWLTHYSIYDLPKFDTINSLLKKIGSVIKSNNIRVSYHPSPFNVLASENIAVVNNTIDELNKHAEIMDLMELDQSTYYPINIHIGTTKPSLLEASQKFCNQFENLSDSCKKRLVVENDDSITQYSVKFLYDNVYSKIGIPITVDSLHYQCHPDNMSWEDTLRLGVSTWKTKPLCHHSSSKKLHEDGSSKLTAHADFIYEKFDSFDLDLDIELECKQKDISLFRYQKEYTL